MKELCADLLAEYSQLALLAEALTPEQWVQKTPYYAWTPWDEIAHLCFFDETGTLAATNPDGFTADTNELLKQLGRGLEIDAIARERFGHLSGSQLVSYWKQRFEGLIDILSRMEAKARLPWYGPMMSVRSFATARMMETWAHGQDIYDLMGRQRTSSDRIKNIAHLGVSTFGWTFINRNLPVPEPAPYIELKAPSGKNWIWNDPPSKENYLHGSAEEFCLVATQRRNIADTGLQYAGSAAAWLAIAQCYAGPPEDAPAPGTRAMQY
jgi:uncharacterized protein (TIGR03084 family)